MNQRFLKKSTIPLYLLIIFFTSIVSVIGFFVFSWHPEWESFIFLLPSAILGGHALWTLVTHLFFHANFFHLFVNMFSLFFIGNITETIIGKRRFFWFYLISGIFAGLFFVCMAWFGSSSGLTSVLGSLNIPGVGASGALFGLLGLLAVILPKKKVYLIVGPLIIIILDAIISPLLPSGISSLVSVLFNIILLIMIFSFFFPFSSFSRIALPLEMPLWLAPLLAIVPLVVVSFFVDLPIANTAHFGGLVVGLLYGWYLRMRYQKKIALLGRVFR